MPIPAFTKDGLLPPGIHDCSLEEVRQRFGSFQSSDRRPRLFATFAAFLAKVRKAKLFVALLVDGSFVTSKLAPNDIDLVLVFAAAHDFHADLRPDQYNLVLPQPVHRRWGFDVVVARLGSRAYDAAVELFQQVRNEPEKRKGILRISL